MVVVDTVAVRREDGDMVLVVVQTVAARKEGGDTAVVVADKVVAQRAVVRRGAAYMVVDSGHSS